MGRGFAAVHCCAYTPVYPSPKAPRDHLSLVFGRKGFIAQKGRDAAHREAQRISDAKPRTSLRSYWHTRPKKKEQTPLKTRVRYNKTISVHLLTEPYVDVTAHTAPSQQAVGFPQLRRLGMEVWMNRHQIEELVRRCKRKHA